MKFTRKNQPSSTGCYDVSLALTAQQDKGKLQVLVDGKEVGPPANLAGNMPPGSIRLAEGKHSITFKIVAAAKEDESVKIRLNQLVPVPSSAAAVKAEPPPEKTDDEAPRDGP